MSYILDYKNSAPHSALRALVIGSFFLFFHVLYSSAAAGLEIADANPSLRLTVNQAKERKAGSVKVVFVDTRGESDFKTAHIPDSFNIGLHHIRTKPFLKSLHLILVNAGFSATLLEQEAQALRGEGFKVSILEGGLAGWVQHGEKLTGVQPFAHDFHFISPYTVLSEKGSEAGLNFIGSEDDLKKSGFTDFNGRRLEMPPEKDFGSILRGFGKEGELPQRIVLCNLDGDYKSLPLQLPPDLPQTVFFLKGGLAALKEARETITAMHQPKKQRLKTSETCPTGPSIN
jgi:rhodanese-related sulfurtransferase